ncbi:Bifunctional protein GlmU [Rosistilla carotiformis]|uniref:Bifunctional protein GlmU n=1 Tax=Rosistilla carotiformis TaxID=2528017 RepID=A0A518K0C7_9BACT|nr:NTP transferase domain-containing protein [Rosistilla carotiformis]QDV71175.1 Bifunctional protein GlmU [Rosistilla carotiformis]
MNAPIAVVLAAGKGTRMKSELAKVLFPVCGRPMIHFVIDALQAAGVAKTIVVVGHQQEKVRETLQDRDNIEFVVQAEQLGTGHAVQVCRENLQAHDGPVIVLAGDSPLLQTESLKTLLAEFEKTAPALLQGTLHKADPTGLGRIVRDADGRFTGIVEEKDATDAQRKITEVNMSTYIFNCRDLLDALGQLKQNNSQAEYYLTDCAALLGAAGRPVEALPVLKDCEALSINTREDLAMVDAKMHEMGYADNDA